MPGEDWMRQCWTAAGAGGRCKENAPRDGCRNCRIAYCAYCAGEVRYTCPRGCGPLVPLRNLRA